MKKYSRIITGLVAALTLVVAMMPAMNVKASTEATTKTYTVTLRAGNVGNFDMTKLTDITAQIDGKDVTVIDADENYVTFTLKRGESLASSGLLTDEMDTWLSEYVTPTETYYVVNGLSLASMSDGETSESVRTKKITRNEEYVVDYVKLVDPVPYTVLYVDAASGEQLRMPSIRYGSATETAFVVSPISIANYTAIDGVATIDLSKGEAITVTFRYTYSGPVDTVTSTVTTYVPGGTTTNTIINEIPTAVPAAAAVAGGGAGAAAPAVVIPDDDTPLADGADGEGEGDAPAVEIEDEETPLADGTDSSDETTIEDEETPLAAGETSALGLQPILATVFGVVIAGAVVTLVIYKRKNASAPAGNDKSEK